MAKLLTGTRIYGTGTVDTQLFVNGTEQSTSTTTGALEVVGGVGIGGNLHVGGISVSAGVQSTNIVASGTLGVTGTTTLTVLNATSATFSGTLGVTGTSVLSGVQASNIVASGTLGVTGTSTLAGLTLITDTTSATSITTGALVVSGGVGIGQDLRVGGVIYGTFNGAVTGTATNAINVLGGTAGQVPYQTAPSTTSFYGPGTAGNVLVSNGAAAPSYNNTLTLTGAAAATNATSGALRVAGGVGINDNLFVTNNINAVSGQIVSTRANNTATGAAQIYLNGATGNRIDFNSNGVAAPAFTTRSAGTRIVLSPGVAAAAVDYALGIESGTLWSSVSTTAQSFKWYGGTTLAATLAGTGNLTLVGDLAVNGGDITTTQTTFNLVDATAVTVNFARAATALTMGAVSGTTNVRNNLTVSGNLTVQGTTTIVDSTVTNIADPIITLGGGTGNTAPTADDNKDRGIAFKWFDTAARLGFFGYDDSTGHLTYIQTATITNEVVSGTKGAVDANLAGGSAMSLVYQSAVNTTAFLAAGSSGFILQTNGTSAAPTWVSAAGIGAGSATNSDAIRTIERTGNADHFLTFVDSNNATNAYESLYTTSSFTINPATGKITANAFSIQTNTTPAVFIKDDNLTAWDYSGKSFSVAGQETAPTGIFFKPDGLQMFVIGSTGDDVNQYSLSVAWDVTTAVFVRVSVTIGETAPTGVHFKPDGSVMYIIGSTNDSVREFSLGTAWDVSTITFVRSFSVAAQESSPQDLWFKPDGTKMYVIGSTGDDVNEYNLSIAWNVSSAVFLQTFSVAAQESVPTAIVFSPDGDKMYVLGASGQDINRYSLSTPWDVSTAVFFNNFYIGFQEASPNGLFINFDSYTAYVVGTSSDTVFQYTTLTDGVELASSSGLFINGSLYTNKNLLVTAGTRIDGTISVSGAATLASTLLVGSTLTANGSVTMATTTGAVNLGTSQTTGATTVGGTAQTGTLTFGRSTVNQTVDIAVGATTAVSTKIVNIGTNGVSGSTTNVNIGSAVAGALGVITIGSTQTIIVATTPSVSTSTGALQVVGGVGIGGDLNVGGTINGNINGTATNSTNADAIRTVARTTNASHFLTFVDSNNATNAYESLYTTSSFVVNPQSGNVGIGTTIPRVKLAIDAGSVAGVSELVNLHNQSTVSGHGTSFTFSGFNLTSSYPTWRFAGIKGLYDTTSSGLNSGGWGGQLRLFVNRGGAADQFEDVVTITGGGSVGVGTTSPTARLHVTEANKVFDNQGNLNVYTSDTPTNDFGGAIALGGRNGQGTDPYVFGKIKGAKEAGGTWNGYLSLGTTRTSSAVIEAMRIDSSGFVGINATALGGRLHVGLTGSANMATTTISSLTNVTSTARAGFSGLTNNGDGIYFGTGLDGGICAGLGLFREAAGWNSAIAFYTNNITDGINVGRFQEKMRITSNGGISFGATGTAYGTSGQVLQSNGDAAPTWVNASTLASGSATNADAIRTVARTTNASHFLTFVDSNNATNAYESLYTTSSFVVNPQSGNVGIGTASPIAKLTVEGQAYFADDIYLRDGATASGDILVRIYDSSDDGIIDVYQNNAVVNRIHGNGSSYFTAGNVGIGTTTPGQKLEVVGSTYLNGSLGVGTTASGVTGEIRATNEITAYYSSDIRLKENIRLIADPITIVNQIRGVYYDWTDEHIAARGGEDGYFVRKHDIGVIAQEVEKVLPEIVATRDDGTKVVKYEKIVALLIEAVKDQQQQINQLSDLVNTLVVK